MNPKILIVEDEPAIADTIQYTLETEGFETICLASGEAVISLLAEDIIDLIVLDIGSIILYAANVVRYFRGERDEMVAGLD